MSAHFSIGPAGGVELARERIKARASADQNIILLSLAPDEDSLVFCVEPQMTDRLRSALAAGGRVWPSACVLTLSPFGVHVNCECADDSLLQQKAFVFWILSEFRPCRVFDDEESVELTELAYTDPQALFA